MRSILLIILLLVATSARSQSRRSDARVDTFNGRGPSQTIFGVVVDSLRAPVPGAYLWFAFEGPRVQTDTAGRFYLRFNRQYDYPLPEKITGYVMIGKRIFTLQLRHGGQQDQFVILPFQRPNLTHD